MRNYISAWLINWNVIIDDGVNPIDNFFTSRAGENREDLMVQVQIENDLIKSGLPAGWNATFLYPTDPQHVFFLFDKANWMKLLNTFPDFFYGAANPAPPAIQPYPTVLETPRYKGWVDVDGVKRDPSPSERK